MQKNKIKTALVLATIFLTISGHTIAATGSFTITVQTVPDVVLSTVTPLNYGANMFVTAAGACFMEASVPGDASADLMQYDGATDTKTNYGDLTGTGCVNGIGAGTPGIYKITGIATNTVNITISSITGTDFNFLPNSGCIVTYGNSTAADTCNIFVPGTSVPKKLPDANAAESPITGGSGATVAGELVFTVGGTVTIGGTDLSSNTPYTQNFPVNVIY